MLPFNFSAVLLRQEEYGSNSAIYMFHLHTYLIKENSAFTPLVIELAAVAQISILSVMVSAFFNPRVRLH